MEWIEYIHIYITMQGALLGEFTRSEAGQFTMAVHVLELGDRSLTNWKTQNKADQGGSSHLRQKAWKLLGEVLVCVCTRS